MQQSEEQVVEIVTNLDDATGEVIGEAMQSLLAEGALDVWTVAIGMKQNRPGVMLSLLVAEADAEKMAVRTMQLTGSFGVRKRVWERTVLRRQSESVMTRFGEIRMKTGWLNDRIISRKWEMDDIKKAAAAHGVSAGQVLREIAMPEQQVQT